MKPFAAPEAVSTPAAGPIAGLGEVTLALVVVLAAVFAVAWLVRRLRGFARPGAIGIEVLADVALGTKERAVLLRVGARQLLLGVAPGRVTTLHVLEENLGATEAPEGADGPAPARVPSFRDLLSRSLGR